MRRFLSFLTAVVVAFAVAMWLAMPPKVQPMTFEQRWQERIPEGWYKPFPEPYRPKRAVYPGKRIAISDSVPLPRPRPLVPSKVVPKPIRTEPVRTDPFVIKRMAPTPRRIVI